TDLSLGLWECLCCEPVHCGQVTPLTQDLLAKLSQEAKQLKAHLEKELSTGSDQNPEEFQNIMISLTQSSKTKLTQRTQELQQNLAPYGEDLTTQLSPRSASNQTDLTCSTRTAY
uniref:apolipoprotein A-IV a n=1 Tax=Oncorhynchus gorbuscha TaxID=8017 RepID=UPI001EAEDDFE